MQEQCDPGRHNKQPPSQLKRPLGHATENKQLEHHYYDDDGQQVSYGLHKFAGESAEVLHRVLFPLATMTNVLARQSARSRWSVSTLRLNLHPFPRG